MIIYAIIDELQLCCFLIQLHQIRYAGGFGGEGVPGFGVGFPYGFVVCLVGFAQVGGHGKLVVEVGEAGFGVALTGGEDRPGGLFDLYFLFGGGVGPGEVVVDDVF